ncbi:TPA: radical SAM protein [Candidatus Woesearchaeota archaeon]|nr:radical SAM protein [Candidatus Woesearchaeota archaeon]HIH12806.1 radical SAM protein [Candidatus Woesearchaeota archaeon]
MIVKEYTAGISLTEACNMACQHCYIGRKSFWKKNNYQIKSISLDKFKQLLPQLVEANVTRVNFGGGESPLHPNFIEIAKKLYDAGIKTSLVTNGSTIKIIKPFLHLFNDIGVSIDFPDERHSDNRRQSKAFFWATTALNEIVDSGKTKTEMVTCIMNTNYNILPELYTLAQSLGVDMWRLNRFHPTKNDISRFSVNITGLDEVIDISYLACSREQMREAFEFLASVSPPPNSQNYTIPDPVFRILVGGKRVISGVPYGQISFKIKSDGGVVQNLFTDNAAGNVFDRPLREILESNEYNKSPSDLSGKCITCTNAEHCKGGDITDTILWNELNDPYCFLDTSKMVDIKLVPLSHTNFVHESYLGTIYVPIAWRLKS